MDDVGSDKRSLSRASVVLWCQDRYDCSLDELQMRLIYIPKGRRFLHTDLMESRAQLSTMYIFAST